MFQLQSFDPIPVKLSANATTFALATTFVGSIRTSEANKIDTTKPTKLQNFGRTRPIWRGFTQFSGYYRALLKGDARLLQAKKAEVVSKSSNKIDLTWGPPLGRAMYFSEIVMLSRIPFRLSASSACQLSSTCIQNTATDGSVAHESPFIGHLIQLA